MCPPDSKRHVLGNAITFEQPEVPYTAIYMCSRFEQHGWSPSLVDLHGAFQEDTLSYETLASLLAKAPPDLVLMSPLTGNYGLARQTIAAVRSIYPRTRIAAGGPHASACSEELIRDGFDIVVRGPGEDMVTRLANDPDYFACAKGVIEGTAKQIIETPADWPIPNYELLPARFRKSYYTRIFSARGCPYRCVFCSDTVWNGRKPEYRELDRIEKEIASAKKTIDFQEIYVSDETFGIDQDHADSVAKLLRKSGVLWGCESRIDTVTPRMLAKLSECGCREIDYGIESLASVVLDRVNKHYGLDRVVTVLEQTAEVGMRTHVNIMVGLPGETAETARGTREQVAALIRAGLINTVDSFITVPYPGSLLHDSAQQYGLRLRHKDWDRYREEALPVFDLDTMSAEGIYAAWNETIELFAEAMESRSDSGNASGDRQVSTSL